MHDAAFDFIDRALSRHSLPRGLTVEIGGRFVNGRVRHLFPEPYIGIDVRPGADVDVVADGATYVPPEPTACVVCCEVLEHTPQARDICQHAYEMLKPGGVLLLTAAGAGRAPHSAIDGCWLREGEHYANIEADDLAEWLGAFSSVEIQCNEETRDIYAVATK